MRLPGTPRNCGPIWELGWVSRQLNLGRPVPEGNDTIPVAAIIGTVERGRDFDACWHPLNARLAKALDDIQADAPAALDEPIDVIRVDRAYFVVDGHKRVALARRSDREFLDATISRAPSTYAVDAEVAEQAVFRTARESEFRRHSGMETAFPEVRFALFDIDDYGELFQAVQTHAFEMSEREGRIVDRDDVARDWYTTDYQPTVAAARASVGQYLEECSDADIYLAIHRRRLAWWGSECDDPDCAAQEFLVEQQLAAARRRSLVSLIRGPAGAADSPPELLPLSDRPKA
jgi:hypothetical protein